MSIVNCTRMTILKLAEKDSLLNLKLCPLDEEAGTSFRHPYSFKESFFHLTL